MPASLQSNVKYLARREGQCLVQFLMALRDDFERLRGNILHRHSHPSVDIVVSELLVEQTRLKTQVGNDPFVISSLSVLVVPSKPFLNNRTKPLAQVSFDECNFCKQKGHWKAWCPKLLHKAQHLSNLLLCNRCGDHLLLCSNEILEDNLNSELIGHHNQILQHLYLKLEHSQILTWWLF